MENNPRIILASGSASRASMLRGCGLEFSITPADIDEESLTQEMLENKASPNEIATALANKKTLSISAQNKDALVIGSDQILECEGRLFSKAQNLNEAKEKLNALKDKTHKLISAVSLAYNGEIIWSTAEEARLTMNNFDDEFLESYCAKAGNALTTCVGAYALEEAGSWLFSKIDGDYFTILGMPLLPLLNELRQNHGVMP